MTPFGRVILSSGGDSTACASSVERVCVNGCGDFGPKVGRAARIDAAIEVGLEVRKFLVELLVSAAELVVGLGKPEGK